ncbi:MAG: cytochrome ubiquinol oxidase subunit I, partial [Pseudonocardia sp.]|nr:cytochrome ubiquinol oxidase subunit I [Pseudonocardia sp.]
TSCPPPRHNFTELPRIRSERPAFELHYPHLVPRLRAEAHGRNGHATASEVAATRIAPEQLPRSDPKAR